jgi:hypothetical protein
MQLYGRNNLMEPMIDSIFFICSVNDALGNIKAVSKGGQLSALKNILRITMVPRSTII